MKTNLHFKGSVDLLNRFCSNSIGDACGCNIFLITNSWTFENSKMCAWLFSYTAIRKEKQGANEQELESGRENRDNSLVVDKVRKKVAITRFGQNLFKHVNKSEWCGVHKVACHSSAPSLCTLIFVISRHKKMSHVQLRRAVNAQIFVASRHRKF